MVMSNLERKVKVLVFGASLREDSLNRKLAGLAARLAQEGGATVDHAVMENSMFHLSTETASRSAVFHAAPRSCDAGYPHATHSLFRRRNTMARCPGCSRT